MPDMRQWHGYILESVVFWSKFSSSFLPRFQAITIGSCQYWNLCCPLTAPSQYLNQCCPIFNGNSVAMISVRPIPQEVPKIPIRKMSLETTLIKLLSHLPGTNELRYRERCTANHLLELTTGVVPNHGIRSHWKIRAFVTIQRMHGHHCWYGRCV